MASVVRDLLSIVPDLTKVARKPVRVAYDRGADVLYVSFERPQKATNTVDRGDGVLLRYRGRKLVGVTILSASNR